MRKIITIVTLSILLFGYGCKTKKSTNTIQSDNGKIKITDSGLSFYYTVDGDNPYKFTMLIDRNEKSTSTYWFSEKNNNYNGVMKFDNIALENSKRQVMAPFNKERVRNDRLFRVLSKVDFEMFKTQKISFIRITDRYEGLFKIIGEEEFEINTFGINKKYTIKIAECKEVKLQFKYIDNPDFPLIVSIRSDKEMKLNRIAKPELKNFNFNNLIRAGVDKRTQLFFNNYIKDRSFTYQKTPSISVTKSSLGGIHFNTNNGVITDVFLLDNEQKYNCRNRKFQYKTAEGLYIGMTKSELEIIAGKGEPLVDGGSLYYSKINAEISFKKKMSSKNEMISVITEIHYFNI